MKNLTMEFTNSDENGTSVVNVVSLAWEAVEVTDDGSSFMEEVQIYKTLQITVKWHRTQLYINHHICLLNLSHGSFMLPERDCGDRLGLGFLFYTEIGNRDLSRIFDM